MGQGGNRGNSETGPDSRYLLNVKTIRLTLILDVGVQEKVRN